MSRRVPPRVGSAALVVLAGLCTSGIFSPVPLLSDGALPLLGGETRARAAMPGIAPGAPSTWGVGGLCLTRPGRVTVVGVEAADPRGGMRVTAFALGEHPSRHDRQLFGEALVSLGEVLAGRGADRDTLAAAQGLHTGGPLVVDGRCGVDAEWSQLVVEVVRPEPGTASMQGVTVTYLVPGDDLPRTVRVGMGVTLCGPDDMEGMFCDLDSRPDA